MIVMNWEILLTFQYSRETNQRSDNYINSVFSPSFTFAFETFTLPELKNSSSVA